MNSEETNKNIKKTNFVIFPDGNSDIDYVLVYVKLLSISAKKNEVLATLREKFIEVLTKKYKIQIQEVNLYFDN